MPFVASAAFINAQISSYSLIYLYFLSELCKGIDPFSPQFFSSEWLNGKGFFFFFFLHSVNEVVTGSGRGVFITAGTSKPSTGVAGILGEKSSKIDQSGYILKGWMRYVVLWECYGNYTLMCNLSAVLVRTAGVRGADHEMELLLLPYLYSFYAFQPFI